MRRRSKNTNSIILLTMYTLVVLVLVTTTLVCGVYARYTSQESSVDNARIAAFVFAVDDGALNSTDLDLSMIKNPGDKVDYTFIVNNFDGDSVSETALDCTISLELNGSMPLKCTITEITDSQENSVLQADMVGESETAPLALPLSKSYSQAFEASQKKSCTYKLTVEWPKALNDVRFASRSAVAQVVLTISAEQA